MRTRGKKFGRLRRMRLRWKIFWSAAALGVVAAMAIGIAMLMAEDPPVLSFERAQEYIRSARKAEAAQYAPHLLRGAETRLEEARFAWQMQNARWTPLRDFSRTRTLTLDALRRAGTAERRAIAVKDSLKTFSEERIAEVSSNIRSFHSSYGEVPISGAHRRSATKSEVLLNEARLAYKRGDYIRSTLKVQSASRLIETAASGSEKFLNGYMANLSQWRRWANETIAWSSREQKVAIVVDKMARKCKVYRAGKLAAQYPVELGYNWIGDKRRRGDKATPEGRYHVRRKKGAGQTKYHRALEIDFPNASDLAAFREAKRRGEIPRNAGIGGVIEIHGDGGRGANWTEGCVALRNDHMEKVFALAGVGTPVTIVGALETDSLARNNHRRHSAAQ